jgi:hypothetical protein
VFPVQSREELSLGQPTDELQPFHDGALARAVLPDEYAQAADRERDVAHAAEPLYPDLDEPVDHSA